MDLKTLRYFIVVAEERNITHAAKILMMSQPPLSNQMKNLEEELHVKLFIRGRRNLTLTEEGQYLYQKAKDILTLTDKTTDDLSSMGQGLSGTISVGITRAFEEKDLAHWISLFQKEHPLVRFRIRSESSDALVEKMRLGLISLAIIASPYDEVTLNAIPLETKDCVACFRKDSPLGGDDGPVSLDELVKQPLIIPERKEWQDIIHKWFRKAKLEPSVAYETDDWKHALALSESGLGVAVVPDMDQPNEKLSKRPIQGKDHDIRYFLVWRKGHPLPTIEENFIDHIKSLHQID